MEESREFRRQKAIGFIVTILLVLAVALCLYSTVQVLSKGYVNIGGFMMFRVVTGSMEPTIQTGSLLLAKETDIEKVAVNDIICFRTQVAEIWGKIVTHRVIGITETEAGSLLLETKGDANLVADGYYVDSSNFIGKIIWHTGDGSFLADLLSLFTSKIGFLGCIALPVLLLAALILKNTVNNIRLEMEIAVEEERRKQLLSSEEDALCGMTQEEYNEMYERIRTELIEELMRFDELQSEQKRSSDGNETEQ